MQCRTSVCGQRPDTEVRLTQSSRYERILLHRVRMQRGAPAVASFSSLRSELVCG